MRTCLAVLSLLAAVTAPVAAQQGQPPAVPRPAANPAPPAATTVWGQVRSDRTGVPLPNAIVEVVTRSPARFNAVTDSNGVYVLRGVPAGQRVLRATHFDHAPHEVEILVVADRQETVDFDLEFRPVRLAVLTAEGARIGLPPVVDTVSVVAADLAPATARVLESTPGGVAELGMADAAREARGSEPVDPTDVLYVRGGATDLKLVLMNGAPVYAPFHIGGLINALDARVLRSASLYLGGAPSRLDGGLSYILELESRSGRDRRLHGEVAVDMLAGRGMLEGPLGPHASFLVAGRGVHGSGTPAWMMDEFPYSYGDGLGRVDVRLAPEHTVTGTYFWNSEEVRLDTIGAARERAAWGNRAGSVRYRGTYGDLGVLGTVAMGQFRTTLPLGGIRPLLTEGTATRGRVGVDFERPLGHVRLFWGGMTERIEFEYRAFPQGAHRDSSIVRNVARGDNGGLYVDALFNVLPRLTVRGGVRADVFAHTDDVQFAPRAAATLLLTDRAIITLSAGQYRQYIRTPERSLVFLPNLPPDSADGPPLTVAEAAHVVLTLTQDLGDGVRFGVEGFFKEFTGLHAAPQRKTETSGVDLWVRRASGSLVGWLGYSLAWVWTVDADRPRGSEEFAGRHLVTSGLSGPLMGSGAFEIRASYGAGLPFTAVPEPPIASPGFSVSPASAHGSSLPSLAAAGNPDVPAMATEPHDPFLRIDAQVSHTFSGAVRRTEFQFTPYLRIINALNRRDAIFYHYDAKAGRAEPLAGLPVMPILGAEWRF
ncbi:MAG TPA: TonB-dependent receptor [Longimicrobiales bacterium]|nr:TonB-dependent receptor [Longimicrobiales bacterium]